mgnify:FL=1
MKGHNIGFDFDIYSLLQILLHLHVFHGYNLRIIRFILSMNIGAILMIDNFMVASKFHLCLMANILDEYVA